MRVLPISGCLPGVTARWSILREIYDLDESGVVVGFARRMVKKIYNEYAVERGITEITPEVMNSARSELGLEEM